MRDAGRLRTKRRIARLATVVGATLPLLGTVVGATLPLFACAQQAGPQRYRLTDSGTHWDVVGADRVLDDLLPRYPDFFSVVLDPSRSDEPPLRRLRDDLEHQPADRRNFDALNALAIGYFELNYRSEALRQEAGLGFLTGGLRSAQLLAIPWRAYGEIDEPHLRDAILDFYEDAGTSSKLGAAATAGRLVRIVGSLAAKEPDPGRRRRIQELESRLGARLPPP